MPRRESDAGRHLAWVFIQGFIFMPPVLGSFFSNEPLWIPGLLVNVALAAWLGYAVTRNLARLWRLTSESASLSFVLALVIVAVIFALVCALKIFAATNDVVAIDEGKHVPTAVVLGVLTVALLVLAVRAGVRTASQRSRVPV